MTKKKLFGTAGLAVAVLALVGVAGNAAAADSFVLGVQSSGGTAPFCYNGWTLRLVPDLQCRNECLIDYINNQYSEHPWEASANQAQRNACMNACGDTIVRVPCTNSAKRTEPDPLPW